MPPEELCMSSPKPCASEQYFYCREGMYRTGPFSRRDLIRRLIAGVMDAHTLVSEGESRAMLPLGASAASGVITDTLRRWRWQFSPTFYIVWMIFVPLATASIAGYGLRFSNGIPLLMTAAILLGQLSMTWWLCQAWRILLADQPFYKAAFYSLPMAIPLVNCIWIWIGYMKLPDHWREFRSRHKINQRFSVRIYYLAATVFYLMNLLIIACLFTSGTLHDTLVYLLGASSWLWFGLTLMSLFITDHFTAGMIKEKLSNLAFGALRFCADINYDILHRTVTAVYLRVDLKFRAFCAIVLLLSWLIGGWIWMLALETYLS